MPTYHCVQVSLCPHTTVSQSHYTHTTVSKSHYTHTPLCPSLIIPTYHCVPVSLFPHTTVSKSHYTHTHHRVKVQVAILDSSSLISLMVSVDVKQDCTEPFFFISSSSNAVARLQDASGKLNWYFRCLMSSDVNWHIRDKLWPMPKHGSINLYVHGNQKARKDGQPRTATSTLTQLLNYARHFSKTVRSIRPVYAACIDWF